MPHELLMPMRSFFEHGQVGNWLGQANSVTCLPEGQAGIQVFVESCILENKKVNRGLFCYKTPAISK